LIFRRIFSLRTYFKLKDCNFKSQFTNSVFFKVLKDNEGINIPEILVVIAVIAATATVISYKLTNSLKTVHNNSISKMGSFMQSGY